eukprot:559033-Lingulodinium_polyedra.AAC.1
MTFATANGPYKASKALEMDTPGLGPAGSSAYVMHDSPSALSVGQRCVNQGYSFVWVKNKLPCFVLPDEGVAVMTVAKCC